MKKLFLGLAFASSVVGMVNAYKIRSVTAGTGKALPADVEAVVLRAEAAAEAAVAASKVAEGQGHMLSSLQPGILTWGYDDAVGYLAGIADQLYNHHLRHEYNAIPELIGQLNYTAAVIKAKNYVRHDKNNVEYLGQDHYVVMLPKKYTTKPPHKN